MHPTLQKLGLGLFVMLSAVPLVLGFLYALLYSLGLVGLLNTGFTLDHWIAILESVALWKSLGLSFGVAIASIGIAVVLAMILVLRWQKQLEGGPLAFGMYLPLALPAMVVAFFSFQLLSKGGILSRLSYALGWTTALEQFPDWVNDNYGIAIIFSHVLMATPFFTLLFSKLYQSEQLGAYSQVAASLGANGRAIQRRIIVPVIFQKARATLLLYFIFVMGSYEIPLLLGSQSPQMVSVLTIRKLQRFDLMDIPQAYAISVLYTILVIALVLLFLKKTPKRQAA